MAEPLTSSSTWAGPRRSPTARHIAVAIRTLGCKVNRVDSEEIASGLLGMGAFLVAEEDADVIVINTCAVTAEAERKARKAARHAANLPSAPVVVVTGCTATVGAERMGTLGERIVLEADKERVAMRVMELVAEEGAVETTSDHVPSTEDSGNEDVFRTRRMLKIEDGCDAFCAYCIVPYARGVPRSVPFDEVVSQARALAESGVPEIVLTGINIGCYDSDGRRLADVVNAVAESGVHRLRLSSVEPLDLDARLLGVLAGHQAVCPHLHIPLQSGSNAVLETMGRGYTIERYEDVIAQVREAIPGCAVTTDVMVGFPGESDADFRATVDTCERIGFTRLHVFRYSSRPGTRAALLSGQVEARQAEERATLLRDTDASLRKRFVERFLGRTEELLVERVHDGVAEGTTGHYLKVRIPAEGLSPGAIVQVRLLGAQGEWVRGEPV